MNYQRIYNQLIDRAKKRCLEGYKEVHHIVPRSMGGSDEKDNLVELTAREHFIAHWLLWRIHRNQKMAFAFNMMCGDRHRNRKVNSLAYQAAREVLKGIQLSDETRKKMSESQKGKKKSKEAVEKMKRSKTGSKHTEVQNKAKSERMRKPVLCNELNIIFETILLAREVTGISEAALREHLHGKNPSKRRMKGFTFSYIDKETGNVIH